MDTEINLPPDNRVNAHTAALRIDKEPAYSSICLSACDVLQKQSSLTRCTQGTGQAQDKAI